ncbi:MAG: DUF4184 family protein [Deinococcota bacterium]
MRTLSHAIVTAAIGSKAKVGQGSLMAFVVGSVLPDLPLGVLILLAINNTADMTAAMVYMDEAYYSMPLWIALHNIPHSFVVMGVVSLLAYLFKQRRWGRWLLWYAAGASLHIAFDMFTHATDGPIFLYPLNTYRFPSPVSYWHPDYYGRLFTFIEYSIDALLVALLGLRVWKYRLQRGN